jgi:hypothetical protein
MCDGLPLKVLSEIFSDHKQQSVGACKVLYIGFAMGRAWILDNFGPTILTIRFGLKWATTAMDRIKHLNNMYKYKTHIEI